ncbi:MAG TPA: beta-glucosidase [Bacteroidetes bacterium]|nr:beta-glucosidase [Bacteroidota bacterium]
MYLRLLSVTALLLLLGVASFAQTTSQTGAPTLQVRRFSFRDLNKNGKLDVYEDRRKPIEKRVENLLSQMTLTEKAGVLFIDGAFINEDGTVDKHPDAKGIVAMLPGTGELIQRKLMNHFNFWSVPRTRAFAIGVNALQKIAEQTRLGIPITFASDPRNAFSNQIFSMAATDFSQWPEQLGFAAIGDEALMAQHADMARQEYIAVGIRMALHPVADLATEPRWARISGTFGEDAALSKKLTKAYVLGFQGKKIGPNSVATMTKHFSGGGPQKEGLDPHFEFQKGQVYPGNNFEYHMIPFEGAFSAHTAAIMPYYGVPVGQTNEDVGFSYNKHIITSILRSRFKFDGVVCTDWGLITDVNMGPVVWPARAWGVEYLSEEERVWKLLEAGIDQFGGESRPELVVSLVQKGRIKETRINESVRRLLRLKFQLGLFENPYIEVEEAVKVVGNPVFMAAGASAQRRSMTLLKNDNNILPLESGKYRIYVKNLNPEIVSRYGKVVQAPEEADFAIIRLQTPWYPVETLNPMAKGFHHGDLDFKGPEKEEVLSLMRKVPTIVDIYLDRPAVIPEIAAKARGLFGNYGASDEALLDVIFGKAQPEGRLPFELPSSMDAVRRQKEDLPYDSENPLYPFGFGLSYTRQ